MSNGLLKAAALSLAAGALWLMLAPAPDRIPPGWSWHARFVGASTFPDPETGIFPPKNQLGMYDRSLSVQSDHRPHSVVLRDDLVTRDPTTKAVTWQYTVHPRVDPATGRHLDHPAEFVVFPRNVERRTYKIRMNYLEGVPLKYIRDEEVEGLDLYVFGYRGRGEYTTSYAGTPEYPGYPVVDGEEIKCADDQFAFTMWIEPVTGEAVKMSEGCPSGDYVFHIASGQPVAPITRWGGETAGADVVRRADWVRRERRKLIARAWAPWALIGCGIALGAAGGLARGRAA